MSPSLAPFIGPYSINAWLYGSALGAIPEEEADRQLEADTNTPRGVALHILMSRHSLATGLGAKTEPLPWDDLGEAFEAGFKQGKAKPTLAEIMTEWDKLSPVFMGVLANAAPEALAQPSPFPIPGIEKATMVDFASLSIVHESYHMGQLGMLTKAITGTGIMTPPRD